MLPNPGLVLAAALLVVLAAVPLAVLLAAPVAARFPSALVSQLEEAVQEHFQVRARVRVPGPVRNPQVLVRVPAHSPPAQELVLALVLAQVPVRTLTLPSPCTCLS